MCTGVRTSATSRRRSRLRCIAGTVLTDWPLNGLHIFMLRIDAVKAACLEEMTFLGGFLECLTC